MTNLLTHFEPSELVDFMNFIGLLIHKLLVGSIGCAISTADFSPERYV